MTARRVVLGVCGGIAAYKAVEICRGLVDAGVHVAPVLTEDATRFVGALTFSALGSETARTSLWEGTSPIPHTRLGQSADLVVVAPATADLLARYTAGMADDLLTATLLATRAPVLVCPAMHTEMWEHPSVQENLDTLRRRGVHVVPPEEGRLAGGDVGPGRLADPATVVARALALLEETGPPAEAGTDAVTGAGVGASATADGDLAGGGLAGRHVVVSAGGTREPLDPVRYLSNRSSGKQGHAVAEAAARRGAAVTLVTASGLGVAADVAGVVAVVPVETAAEMERAVLDAAAAADVVVMAAAVADFRPKAISPTKLARDDGLAEVVLEPTPDILAEVVAARRSGQVIVGFAAETGDVLARARAKLARKGVDLLVANDVTAPRAGFDHDTNAVVILAADGTCTELTLRSKAAVADAIMATVRDRLPDAAGPAGETSDA